jgi:hypothetical protein
MPLLHCNKCHHEWEAIVSGEKCDWCGGDSYILASSTPFERFASTLIANMKDIPPEFAKLAEEHFWDLI